MGKIKETIENKIAKADQGTETKITKVNQGAGTTVAKSESNAFLAYGNAATTRSIIGTLLKFTKGDYIAGSDAEEIPLGTQFVANMDMLSVGWLKWEGAKPIEPCMGLVAEAFEPPRRRELGDLDESEWETDDNGARKDPWQFTNYLLMFEKASGEIYTFTTSSKGGLSAIGQLSKTYGKEIRQRPDSYPVIELGVSSYLHRDRKLGRIKVPTFKIVGGVDKKDYQAPTDDSTPEAPPDDSTPPTGEVAEATGF